MESVTETEWRNEDLSVAVVDRITGNSSEVSNRITYNPFHPYDPLKRLFDVVLAAFGIVVLLPVFLVIAVCIKLEDEGSIFYFREMVGLLGRHFILLKFRTMIPDADSYLEQHPELKLAFQKSMKLQSDPRVTRTGRFLRKTYLDELPQLFNVLLGQMSLVGPRAIHDRELSLYGECVEKRHSVKPGMTGLWQISPDRHRRYEDRIPLDMEYVDHRSLVLDLVIMVKTLRVLIKLTGV
jgi:lipopolysaccharide/colanic/teichoic acid biosynthesis glycosyltransferase